MEHVWAETALTPDGWQQNVRVTLDAGRIASVTADAPPQGTRVRCLLPAPANAHSHAFQRAMAGLTERSGPDPSDTFWTWRQLMFRFLDRITPEQVQAIAAFVQMEMLEAGYATNVEFHYLHHQPGGVPYARLSELSDRIAAAADLSGIGLTLLPVFYQTGGLDGRGLTSGQQRFGNDAERYARLAEEARARIATGPADWGFGIAPHSLRAAPAGALAEVVGLAPEGPIHMHLAEQKAEVEEVLAATGKRPVEWVLDTLAPDHRWHFIHCTQMEPHETEGLARSGATAVLCPLTEASLGDGIFDGIRWMGAGGRIAVGANGNAPTRTHPLDGCGWAHCRWLRQQYPHQPGRGTAPARYQPAPARPFPRRAGNTRVFHRAQVVRRGQSGWRGFGRAANGRACCWQLGRYAGARHDPPGP